MDALAMTSVRTIWAIGGGRWTVSEPCHYLSPFFNHHATMLEIKTPNRIVTITGGFKGKTFTKNMQTIINQIDTTTKLFQKLFAQEKRSLSTCAWQNGGLDQKLLTS